MQRLEIPGLKEKDLPDNQQVSFHCGCIFIPLLVNILPITAAIIMVIVAVVSVMAIIRAVALVVIAVGIPRLYGNNNLRSRFRWNQSNKPEDG